MIAFIDDHRDAYGVEPICRVLPIAPSTYHERVAQRQDPTRLSARARQDAALRPEIARVFAENFAVYGVRKVWRQMIREGVPVARCTVARLMREMGLAGVIRGKPVRTTISDKAAPCPLDHVNRQFYAPAPNMLWVSDFTYVATWAGFVYVAFVIDTYARRIVGWRASRTAHARFVLDALEQALHDRRPTHRGGLIHHSDRGSQYVSMPGLEYTERLAEAGIEPSVGSVGDSYDNALAETINGLYKAEVIHRADHGAASKRSNMPRWSGSTGSTIAGCWSPSATSRLPKPKINIMLPRTKSIWQRDSQPNASGRPGAVQSVILRIYCMRRQRGEADVTASLNALFSTEVVDCMSEARPPSVRELFLVAQRIWSEGAPDRSAFSWGRLDPVSADRIFALRAAQVALCGSATSSN